MLAEADLPLRFVADGVFIDFLGPQDEPWLRVLVNEMTRFEGRRRRELCERLAQPLPCEAPHFKRRAAARVLLALWPREKVSAVPPVQARGRLFAAAAASREPAATVCARVAAGFGVTPEALAKALFADLPGERIVRAPDPLPHPGEIALRTNLAVCQALLMRAATVDLTVAGGVRPVVRLAKLRGLLCAVVDVERERAGDEIDGAAADLPTLPPTLSISGPFSLFRHTLLYGRALAELLPHLAWCGQYELRASCSLGGRLYRLSLDSAAPLFVATAPPPTFDSGLEERFAQDFARLAPDWDVIREPEAVQAGRTLIFPDFLLRHRTDVSRRVLVEILGFWSPEYLRSKLERLRRANLGRIILCVDDQRCCGDGDFPPQAAVVRFRRRVDAVSVLAVAERLCAVDGEVAVG